jgi:DNA-binding response OmpR family regulator
MKILWVDDQLDVARTFAQPLRENGAEVEFCGDATSALARLSSNRYDLVLCDLAMPPGRWGGIWLLEQLRLRPSSPPVVIISGEGSQLETIQAMRLGAVDYVTKENIDKELLKQVQAALAHRTADQRSETIPTMISSGESASLEFKSTLRHNIHSKRHDSNMELAVLKTLAGFLNADGGTLLVGVSDRGETVGIEADGFQNNDRFQLHFWNLFRESIGSEFSAFVTAECVAHREKTICVVRCRPSNRPVFVRWKNAGESQHQELFFVRAGPQTEQLGTRQALAYITDHFQGPRP